jgi:uncharacterized coiled-coil protein SlyX
MARTQREDNQIQDLWIQQTKTSVMLDNVSKTVEKINGKMDELIQKFDDLPVTYVTRTEHDQFDNRLSQLESDKKKIISLVVSTTLKWLIPVVMITGIVFAVISKVASKFMPF